MYRTCPKCSHRRSASDSGPEDICPGCGLVFSKWLQNRFRDAASPSSDQSRESDLLPRLSATVLYVPAHTDPAAWVGRLVLYLGFFIWGWSFILMTVDSNEIGRSFMHNINLVFHEAGHVIFRPFGRFMTILGGSLTQLLMPLIVMIALLWKNADTFGASLGLWWLAQSLMDLAPYVADARAGSLMLLGGFTGRDMPGVHDWRNILSELGCLQHDVAIAAAVDLVGEGLMLLALLWGGYILWLQHRNKPTSTAVV